MLLILTQVPSSELRLTERGLQPKKSYLFFPQIQTKVAKVFISKIFMGNPIV